MVFKMAVQIFNTESSFRNFDGLIAFFPNSTGPWLQLQKGRKIPVIFCSERCKGYLDKHLNYLVVTSCSMNFIVLFNG